MKNHYVLAAAVALLLCANAQAQINNVFDRAVRAGERRVNNKIDRAIDKGYDKAEESAKKKKDTDKNQDKSKTQGNKKTDVGDGGSDSDAEGGTPAKTASLKSYGKFDFVPGEKIIAHEDFMQDAVGDFPDKWNSTGSGEIVTLEGKPGHWLMLNKQGTYLPEFIKSLPDNCTLQFDLACNETFSFYSSYLWVNLVAMANPAQEFAKWGRFPSPTEGVRVGLHPQGAGSGPTGITEFVTYAKGAELLKNESDQHMFAAKAKNVVKVSMWRQKQRLRVYVDEHKIWDVPRAFQPGITYNGLVVSMGGTHKADDRYFLSNLRLAVGAPDTRNKLLTEGKFVTRGILFDVNSDKIKPESFGVLKEIAQVLQENPAVKVKIIGHTDSDGDAAKNTDLSKRRAASVKNAIAGEFGIDDSRMETDGKGATQPSGPNTTAEGKANNRRVEFIKL